MYVESFRNMINLCPLDLSVGAFTPIPKSLRLNPEQNTRRFALIVRQPNDLNAGRVLGEIGCFGIPDLQSQLRLAFLRISSGVLVHTKGWQRSFQPLMKARILIIRSRTEGRCPVDGLALDDAEPDLDQVQPRS